MKKKTEKKVYSGREKVLAWIMIGIMAFGIVAATLSIVLTNHVH